MACTFGFGLIILISQVLICLAVRNDLYKKMSVSQNGTPYSSLSAHNFAQGFTKTGIRYMIDYVVFDYRYLIVFLKSYRYFKHFSKKQPCSGRGAFQSWTTNKVLYLYSAPPFSTDNINKGHELPQKIAFI